MFHILILHMFKNRSGVILRRPSLKNLVENKITSTVFLHVQSKLKNFTVVTCEQLGGIFSPLRQFRQGLLSVHLQTELLFIQLPIILLVCL